MTFVSKFMALGASVVLCVSGVALAADDIKINLADEATKIVEKAKEYAGFADQMEQVSYIIGNNFAMQVKTQFEKADISMLIKGITDTFEGKELAIPEADHQAIMEKFAAAAQGMPADPEAAPIKDYVGFSSDDQKASYVIGTIFASQMQSQPFKVAKTKLIDAINDTIAGKELAIPEADHQAIMMAFREVIMAQMEKERQDKLDAAGWKTKLEKPELMSFDAAKDYFWVLETSKGTVKIKLWPEVAPMHVTSTIFLTNKKFYDSLTFHRIIPGFMAQGGCPLGDGTGGPGYEYDSECKDSVKHDKPYLLSMANAGPGTDGSQFFITFVPTPHLDGKHTVFGEVVQGKEVVKALEQIGSQTGQTKEPVTIVKATIEETAKP
ncbi:MAG: peptidylprolyl isomerase [Sedimentisphaerales bacterium]|nr:peptidylprolyl isomerase [Sedimentisphaerales bacterium]